MISAGDTVGVGLSGGADSVALTHFLYNNREKLLIKELKAVHVHHGIRGDEADRDMEFAESFCESLGIELLSFKADIPAEAARTGESVEECARRVRYDCFKKAGCDKFATAHNLNDNAETFFFNLARGTSLTGLTGIPYVRDFYIRPLLDCTRNEIEEYIKENGLSFVTDSTNLSDDYTRNKIRHNILPLFFELNPSFDKAFSRCLESLYNAKEYIEDETEELYLKSKKDGFFDCSVFKDEREAVRFSAIRMILKSENVKDISYEHIKAVDNIIKNGGAANLPKASVLSERQRLYFKVPEIPECFEMRISSENVRTPIGSFKIKAYCQKDLQNLNKRVLDNLIDCDKITSNLVLRNRRDGDSVRLYGRNGTKTLKKLFNERKIPVSKRPGIAILSDDNGIIWLEGFGVSERARPSGETKKYLYLERAGE